MRLPGISNFQSSNTLQNSSHIYSIPKSIRINDKGYRKLCDNIYNIPDSKSKRATNLGYGNRSHIFDDLEKFPSPQEYKFESLFDYNLKHRKGITILGKPAELSTKDRTPGVGAYKLKEVEKYGNIPISIKFRHGFYYDDEMKKKEATVSMQAYTPKYNYIKINRYKGAGIGFGQRNTIAPKIGPGPGEYKIPRIFERGVKKDLAIN